MANIDKKNVRFNILSILVYVIGIILIVQLFNLQIIHGEEYLETANSRLTRENTLRAARGDILDCNGNLLAGTKIEYSLKIFKSKIDANTLNNTILNTINVLEKNEDEYKDEFPINIEPIEFKYENQEQVKKWLISNDLDENLVADEALKKYIQKYELESYSIEDARKIISIRYGIDKNGYTSMRGYEIATDISANTIAQFEEMSDSFPRNFNRVQAY